MLEITNRLYIPLNEIEFSFSRSSGSGGQNVNKVNSKATLYWRPTDCQTLPADVLERFVDRYHRKLTKEGMLILQSDRHRDQPQNIDDCLEKLRHMILEVAYPPKPRKATKPTKSSKRKRLDSKKRHSIKKQNRKNTNFD
jgi:ribosome-associated protein